MANDIGNGTWTEDPAGNTAAAPNGFSGSIRPSAVEPTLRETHGAIKRWYVHSNATQISGGSANAHTLTYSVAPEAYVTGDAYTFIAGYTNTGAVTLNVNGLGARTIRLGNTAIASGELSRNRVYTVYYDGAYWQLANTSATLSSLGLGNDSTEFFDRTQLPLRMESNEPAPPIPDFGVPEPFSTLLNLQHNTNGTPTAKGMFGAVIGVTQDIASSSVAPAIEYMGAALVGSMSASEGGFDTTLAADAGPGDFTLTLTDASNIPLGVVTVINVVADNGLVGAYAITDVVGNVVTIANTPLWQLSAGALAYGWRGVVKGANVDAATSGSVSGVFLDALEIAVHAQAGTRPYMKNALLLGAFSDDAVQAIGPYDSALAISVASGAAGFKAAISIDDRSGQFPLSADGSGTVIKTFGGAALDGIDFSTTQFTGDAIATPGFAVSGAGSPTITHNYPTLTFANAEQSVVGGRWRIIQRDQKLYFQVNTSESGDFTTEGDLLVLNYNGTVQMPTLPRSGAVYGNVCVDVDGNLFVVPV